VVGFWAGPEPWANLGAMVTPRLRLGQLLVDAKMVSEGDLQAVLALQQSDGRRLGTLLVERGLINETQLTQILSHQLSIPWVSLLHIEFSRQLLNLVPHDVADRYCLVPIYVRHVRQQGETLYVAMDDPTNEDGLRACREHSGLPVRAMIAPPSDIRNAIRVYYGVQGTRSIPPDLVVTEAPPPPAQSAPPAPTSGARGSLTEADVIGEAPVAAPRARGDLIADGGEATVDELTSGPLFLGAEAGAPPLEASPDSEGPATEQAPAIAAGEPFGSATLPDDDGAEDAARVDGELGQGELGEGEEALDRQAIAPPENRAEAPSGRTWGGGGMTPERLRAILGAEAAPPSSSRDVGAIPRPRGRAPRMVALTLLDGTSVSLPAKRSRRTMSRVGSGARGAALAASLAAGAEPQGRAAEGPQTRGRPARASDPPGSEVAHMTARDLVKALRAAAQGADASEVLGADVRWEAVFAALLSLLLKKHLIADWEFVDELKKKL
jgi:Type II secretion system (T2SS), protein E, N-terminal domain